MICLYCSYPYADPVWSSALISSLFIASGSCSTLTSVSTSSGSFFFFFQAEDGIRDEPDIPGRPSDLDDAQRTTARRIFNVCGERMIDCDYCNAFRFHQVPEQDQLGLAVRFRRAVIVEVVAADIGKARDADAQAIEAVLIEPVGRTLDGQGGCPRAAGAGGEWRDL